LFIEVRIFLKYDYVMNFSRVFSFTFHQKWKLKTSRKSFYFPILLSATIYSLFLKFLFMIIEK